MDIFTPPLSHSNPQAPPTLNEYIYESATAAVELPNLASAGDAHGNASGDFLGSIGESGVVDKVKDAPALPTPSRRTLFDVRTPEPPPKVWEEGAGQPHFQRFPSNLPTLENCFTNQDEDLKDLGYDSGGGLPHFVDEEDDDMEGYSELQIGGNAPAPKAPAAVAAELTAELVTHLAVKDLKDELKKRGRVTTGEKMSCRIA